MIFADPPQLSLIQANSLPTQHSCQTGKDGDSSKATCAASRIFQAMLSRGRGVHKNSGTRSLPAFQALRAGLASPDSAELSIKGRQSVTSSPRQQTLPRARASRAPAVWHQSGKDWARPLLESGNHLFLFLFSFSFSFSFPFFFFLFCFSTTDTDYEDI